MLYWSHESDVCLIRLPQSARLGDGGLCQGVVTFLKELFFPEQQFSTVGLKIFREPGCKQMCCRPSFVVGFIEPRQRGRVGLFRAPAFFGISVAFHLESLAAPATRGVSASSEALKPSIDFFSSESPIGITFQDKSCLHYCLAELSSRLGCSFSMDSC